MLENTRYCSNNQMISVNDKCKQTLGNWCAKCSSSPVVFRNQGEVESSSTVFFAGWSTGSGVLGSRFFFCLLFTLCIGFRLLSAQMGGGWVSSCFKQRQSYNNRTLCPRAFGWHHSVNSAGGRKNLGVYSLCLLRQCPSFLQGTLASNRHFPPARPLCPLAPLPAQCHLPIHGASLGALASERRNGALMWWMDAGLNGTFQC